MTPSSHQAVRQTGIGLIEVLITLLIFSVGVLAIAGLQAVAKRNNYDAVQRTTAANLARFIVSSMRANPQARASYLVSNSNPLGSRQSIGSPPVDCYFADCSATELAAFDLYEWEMALDGASDVVIDSGDADDGGETTQTGGLADPSACILGPADGSAGFYTVIVAWRGITGLDAEGGHDCGANRGIYGNVTGDGSFVDGSTSHQRFFEFRTYISP